MNTKQVRDAYKTFFESSDAGKYFLDALNSMIDSEHEKAETNPDMARDHAQRALGIRQVMMHINSTKVTISHSRRGADGEKQ